MGTEEEDQYGKTPLHVAAKYNMVEASLTLLRNGANLNAWTHGDDGYTPLHYACQSNSHDVALIFVEWGSDLDVVNDVRRIVSNYSFDVLTYSLFSFRTAYPLARLCVESVTW